MAQRRRKGRGLRKSTGTSKRSLQRVLGARDVGPVGAGPVVAGGPVLRFRAVREPDDDLR